MNTILEHPQAIVEVQTIKDGRRVLVKLRDSSLHMQHPGCVTKYSIDLIKKILEVKGPCYLCDEIMRDEHPGYVQSHLENTLLSYVNKKEFAGKRILDFGCGCGASTVILSRLFPETEVVGVELLQDFVDVANLRAEFYQTDNIRFLLSPTPDHLPGEVDKFDYILLHGVFEHLLPEERKSLLPKLWGKLNYNGILFIDETPHRYFPIESHTTGLPIINYLPDQLTFTLSRKFSKRNLGKDSWNTLLRKGIRGATTGEICNILSVDKQVGLKLMDPSEGGINDRIDLWYRGYVNTNISQHRALKKMMKVIIRVIKLVSGITLVPYLSLAIKKQNKTSRQ